MADTGTADLSIRDEDLRYEGTYPVLGIPVRLRTDSEAVLQVAERAFGYWRRLEGHPELVSEERVEGRLVVRAGDEGGPLRAVRHRLVDSHRMLVATPASVCASDARRREFVGWVTPMLVGEADHFRYHVLEALVMSVVTRLDRMPLHGSAVVRGKSTLTWAAAGAGLRVLADDMVFVQRQPLRVWGAPTFLHLPADSRRFFPELAQEPVRLLSSGKEKIPLDLNRRGCAALAPVVERMGLCILQRVETRAPRWRRVGASELQDAMGPLDPGFDLFADDHAELVTRLAAVGGWSLEMGGTPQAAARALHSVFDELEKGG